MEKSINFGIDLGTTNSLIAKFNKGEVIVYNNPLESGKTILPSLVYYRKDQISVGASTQAYLRKEHKNVFGLFKRRMGTNESYQIKALNKSVTPVDLSAQILKTLKTFINPKDKIEAVIITTPASFDSLQSKATIQAGHNAGFKQVVLLQEPIAASLAFANSKKNKTLNDGYWLVYDLGGGTFDIALIKIENRELKVIDHEGDNFLGGTDFDSLMVEKLIIPKLTAEYTFTNLEQEMTSASGKYNAEYFYLLHLAEEAKIRLSAVTSTEIFIDRIKDEKDKEVDLEIVITRSEFNELIKPYIRDTTDMIKTILTRNSLTPSEIEFNLMIGGSTYIPFVREQVEELLQIPIAYEVDPTSAVVVGAAYFASTKQIDLSDKTSDNKEEHQISIRTIYNKSSKEKEELFAARITGNTEGLSYRIVRTDQGYDSGFKKLEERINEDLPLVEDTFNYFTFTVYDSFNNVVKTNFETIGINSGFGIGHQPLPEDICLETDDYNDPEQTKLKLIFAKNIPIPNITKLTRVVNRTIRKGNEDDKLWISVYEGSHYSLPKVNLRIGTIEINGTHVTRDIIKGSEIDFTFTISESRDLTVSAFLTISEQEFKQVFIPKEREVNINYLKNEINELSIKLDREIELSIEKEDYETTKELTTAKKDMEDVSTEIRKLTDDDITDKRYQLEDKKRSVAKKISDATKDKRVQKATDRYHQRKIECEELVNKSGNNYERETLNNIISKEDIYLSSKSPQKIQELTNEVENIIYQIKWRTPEFLLHIFNWIKKEQIKIQDQARAQDLIDAGNFAVENQNWVRLKEIIFNLIDLLPKNVKDEFTTIIGFN